MTRFNTLKYRLAFLSCCFLLLAFGPATVRANHVMGGELTYSLLSSGTGGDTYRVKLTLFADCASAATTTAFAALPTATPQVSVLNNNSLFASLSLTCDLSQSGMEITPVCPAQQDSTKCTSLTYTIPGVVKYVYTADVVLTAASANWKFAFDGQLINSSAGRSASIANINTLGGAQLMYLEATLNNTVGVNSSTNYTSPPTPFFCINVPQSYSLNAVDPNGDSLVFSLIGAKVSAVTNAPYIIPYTPTAPLPAVAGTFNFNTTNGLLNFTPNLSMQAVVVNLVEEYRNGVKVGTSMREMTFVILSNCPNNAPNPGNVTVNNGTVSGANQNLIEVCEGMTDTLRFGFTATDVENDTLTLTFGNLPAGAVATVTNNNTPNPGFSFQWDVSNVPLGVYTFFVTIEDDGCPLSSKQTIGYSISVVPFQQLLNTGAASGCHNENNGYAWISRSATDTGHYRFIWKDATGTIVQSTAAYGTEDTLHNAAPGIYTVEVVNQIGCNTSVQITVEPPTYQATIAVDTAVCVNVPVVFNNISTSDMTSFQWDFGDNTTSTQGSPTHTYTAAGTYQVRLIGGTDFPCADTTYVTMTVHEVILHVTSEQTICAGASTQLSAEGAETYTWTPTLGLSCVNCPNPVASPTMTTVYTVTGADANGCNAAGTVQVNVVPMGLLKAFADTALCPGDSAHLRAEGALAYHWAASPWLTDTSGATTVAYPVTTTTFTVYGDQPQGCVDTAEITVTIFPRGLVSLPDTVSIYPGESYQMDPGGNCMYFQWFPPLGLSGTNIANPLASPPVNTRYFIQAATEAGCLTSDSIDVLVNLESVLDMPNAFTPGSAPNEEFKVAIRGLATLKRFQVFNRWGEKVFETTDIRKGWNGQLNGQPQPMGVYVYMVEAVSSTGRRFSRQGNVTLLR